MLVQKLDSIFYPDFQGNWDDEIFRTVVIDHLKSDMILLDVGAGSGRLIQMNFKDKCKKVVGLDPDESVMTNPNLHEAHIALGGDMPFEDETFDIVISDNVWEHVEKPGDFLEEIRRVLKPGGQYLAKTPNKLHYVPLLANMTPHWFHQLYNSLRGRSADDTFETHYKLNSRAAIFRHAREAGFVVDFFKSYEGRPEYLRISSLTYLFGIVYERLVNLSRLFERFRVIHIVILRKESSTSP